MLEGVYEYKNMIGAKVKLISLPNHQYFIDSEQEFTITSIKFRITVDGKLYPYYILDKHDDCHFTAKDLEIIKPCENV